MFVVVGAAKPGIGDAITRRLLNDGIGVVGTYEEEDKENAELLISDFKDTDLLTLYSLDHSNRQRLLEFCDKVPPNINGIVNAQFFFAMEDPNNFDHDLWDKSLAINLTAPNTLVHELQRKIADDGSIVIITSTEGFVGSFGASAYAASKAAIHNLVKTLANNLGSRRIRVNAIAAGWIGGVMDTDEIFNMSRRITPLGRLGTPEEIAAIVDFLISTKSAFVNGSTITADGGYTGVDTVSKYEFEQTRKKER